MHRLYLRLLAVKLKSENKITDSQTEFKSTDLISLSTFHCIAYSY